MSEANGSKKSETKRAMTTERTVGQGIHAFSNIISGHFFSRTEKQFGVGLAEWRVLRSAILMPGLSQGEVATSEGMNVMNVSRAVAGLRRKRLIEVESDPGDRRKTMLSPTVLGSEVGADIGRREGVVYQHVFSVLSPSEVDHLDDLLARVNNSLRTTNLPDPPPPTRDWGQIIGEQWKKS